MGDLKDNFRHAEKEPMCSWMTKRWKYGVTVRGQTVVSVGRHPKAASLIPWNLNLTVQFRAFMAPRTLLGVDALASFAGHCQ